MLRRLWDEEEGVLTFEWIMMMTLLVIGVIGGTAAIRDAILHEAQSTADAVVSLDQGYSVEPPLGVAVTVLSDTICTSGASGMGFHDSAALSTARLDATELAGIEQVDTENSQLCPLLGALAAAGSGGGPHAPPHH